MKIAIYGRSFGNDFNDSIVNLFEILKANKTEIIIYKPFYDFIKEKIDIDLDQVVFFTKPKDLKKNFDVLLSIGGDGTFLESTIFIKDSKIPIAGINSGRLGFLANISKNEMKSALEKILKKSYSYEERDLIQLETENNLFGEYNFALNELTVQKKDSSSMIIIHVYSKGQFLNTYWADGLIISTPTGSTAYSLSAGGPIVVPNSQNFIITPLAPHNLTIRPLVVPNNQELTLKVEGRDQNFLISLDHRYETFTSSTELKIKKANFKIRMLKHDDRTFFSTLREKLMWGIDKRNI
ncbi:MAG: NAD kinase [Bacteroidales bacterium]|nr:NAD kinase [Bacteroidales bacterium]MBN2758381.1 NAD kinase [Bacteroidales bacterium]